VTERWEIRTEVDRGVSIPSGEPWEGWRVRYRVAGSRGRWRSFLLTAAALPTSEQLEWICDTHAGGEYKPGDRVELTPAS
jgi:hypothetical protein